MLRTPSDSPIKKIVTIIILMRNGTPITLQADIPGKQLMMLASSDNFLKLREIKNIKSCSKHTLASIFFYSEKIVNRISDLLKTG